MRTQGVLKSISVEWHYHSVLSTVHTPGTSSTAHTTRAGNTSRRSTHPPVRNRRNRGGRSADRAWVLTPDQATAYAVLCHRRATEVEHDTAVFRLLLHIGMSPDTASQVITHDLRPDRGVGHPPRAP